MKYPFLTFLLVLLLMIFVPLSSKAQVVSLNMETVIALAQSEAPDVLLANTRLKNSYWRFQTYRSNYRPSIFLNGTLPELNRSLEPITLNDGSETFIQRSFMRNELFVSLNQAISLTGGTIYASSGLSRLDLFKTSLNPGSVSWLSSPIAVGISQPFFQFNDLKWDKKIEPLIYNEAKIRYSEEMERIAYDAVRFFFEVYRFQIILEGAQFDKNNADTLLEISKGRFDVGRIAETDLLQIELSSMNADDAIAESTLNLQSATEQLRNFLGLQNVVSFEVKIPSELPVVMIDPITALNYALKNRSKTLEFQRRLAEADREVDRAQKSNGFSIGVEGRVGFSQTDPALNKAYQDLLDQERLSIGLQIPIADWGRARARRETAKSNRELIQMNVEQEQINLEREIILRVQQFELVKNRVNLSKKSLDIAVKRQEMTRQRYLIGKIGITDLNIALSELDAARRGYIDAQREFWVALYEIRGLTLYDFVEGKPLILEPETN